MSLYNYYPNHPDLLKPPKPPSHTELLLEFTADIELFCSDDGCAYAALPLGRNGVQLIPVQHAVFRDWIISTFYSRHNVPPDDRPLRRILRTLNARALAGSERRPVHLRVASILDDPNGPMIALDLLNNDGETVEITREGWQVSEGLHSFRSSRGAGALPRPVQPDDSAAVLHTLRSLLKPASGQDWTRCLVWLINALWPEGPYPILTLTGPPASGKSTAARLLRGLVDPSAAPLFLLPLTERQLLAHAYRARVLAFDHVTRIPWRISEALCALSTGGGLELPKHYDNSEPAHITLQRPMILSIPHSAGLNLPEELRDRSLPVAMSPLLPRNRSTDEQIRRDFETQRPQILGALCNALSAALRRAGEITPETSSRFASATARALAAAPELGLSEKEILSATSRASLRSDDPVLQAVCALALDERQWAGTPTELLSTLRPRWGRRWPENPRALSQHLNKAAALLESEGVRIAFHRSNGKRHVTVTQVTPTCGTVSRSPQQDQ